MDARTSRFLTGGGETGERLRALDWERHCLGPPSGWPPSLRTTVRVMLDSRFAMWMLWGPRKTFFCNDAYLPTVGLRRDWVLGAPADEVWREIWHDIGPRIDYVLETGDATWDEGLLLFLERNGYTEETFHTFSYSPLHDDQGHREGMLCVVVEVTERMIGERRLRLLRDLAALDLRDESSLEACGQRMVRQLAEGATDLPFAALYLKDAAGAIVPVAFSPALDDEAHRAAFARAAASGALPLAAVLASGREARVEALAQRIAVLRGPWPEAVQEAVVLPLSGSGAPEPFGALVLGLSTRRRLDESYRGFLALVAAQIASRIADAQARFDERRRAQALAELDRAKSVFLANVSHELRTPLTLILGPLGELLQRPDPPGAQDLRSLHLVHRNAERLRKLVNSLLDFSRLESGRLPLQRQATDIAALTREVAAVFRPAVEQAGLRLEVHCDAFAEQLLIDRDLWEKLLLNLLSNAFKFTFEGTISLRLAHADPGTLRLEVQDSGIGIAEADLPKVFGRFERIAGARSRTAEGSGIGLALVQEIVQHHGGRADVRSVLGEGSCFTVELPIEIAAAVPEAGGPPAPPGDPAAAGRWASYVDDALRSVDAPDESELPEEAGAESPHDAGARATVLVVDDNADMRTYLQRLLGARWNVTVARDGAEALARIRAQAPALVLSDVMMPGMSGTELLRRIRDELALPDLPVLLLSAQAGEEARVAGLGTGADDYLVKPFSARELLARIEMQLARARLRSVQVQLDRRLADVFRHATVGLALMQGPQHVFEFVNAHFVEMLGGRELLGLPLIAAIAELEGQGFVELLDTVARTGEAHVGKSVAARLRNPATGELEQRHFDFVYQPLAATGTHAAGIAVVTYEVTDLIVARQEAERASRSKDEFLAVLGHELRNPLAPIATSLQLMRMKGVERFEREWSIIDRQLRHMVRLVDDLLDVSRITSGKIDLRLEVMELAQAAEQAIETTSPLFDRARHRVSVEIPGEGLAVRIDRTRIAQVISNLLSNAARYTPPGKCIHIRAFAQDGSALLCVQDEGIGMSREVLEGIFGLFVQAPQSAERSTGGLGLGLAIARSLARLHGGEVRAQSEGIDRGSCFTLRLPLAQVPAGSAAAPCAAGAPARGTPRRSVLVVDDNRDAALMLAEILQMEGHAVHTAFDAPAALEVAQRVQPDVAIVDIGLPVMDGYELARRLRAADSRATLRIAAVSGYGSATDQRRASEAGIDGYFVKPVDYAKLASFIASPAPEGDTRGA